MRPSRNERVALHHFRTGQKQDPPCTTYRQIEDNRDLSRPSAGPELRSQIKLIMAGCHFDGHALTAFRGCLLDRAKETPHV